MFLKNVLVKIRPDHVQDRGNIGNARVLGMQKDLGLSNQKFFNIILIFCASFPIQLLKASMVY